MIWKIIFGIVIGLFLINSVDAATLCYQEHPNATTVCGGLGTGNYTLPLCDGSPWVNQQNLWDENYNTGGFCPTPSAEYLWETYRKPSGATNTSVWQIKDDCGTRNLTIPTACWDRSTITLRIRSLYDGDSANSTLAVCWNGASWPTLSSCSTSSIIYETTMIWNITDIAEIEQPRMCSLRDGIISLYDGGGFSLYG